MGTQHTEINDDLRDRLARIWASTAGVELSTADCMVLLKRIRTYYMKVWEAQNAAGEIALTAFCKMMIEDTNKIIVAIETERVQADCEIAKTIERYPLLLAPAEQVDFAHILDGELLEVKPNGPSA